jgi:dephospho-CoA kinase
MPTHAVLIDRREQRKEEQKLANSIADRLSEELVFALVGPVGSGVSTAGKYIAEILTQDYGYAVAPVIKPSEIIKAEAHRVGRQNIDLEPLSTYIDEMQTTGNELRKKFGPNYLAEKAVERIVKFRREQGGYGEKGISLPGRRAYIIDSIKNIEELSLLRQIYRDTLCVVGVFAPDMLRKERLISDGAQEAQVQKVLDRDAGEVPTFGQMTRKVFVESDFFYATIEKRRSCGAVSLVSSK